MVMSSQTTWLVCGASLLMIGILLCLQFLSSRDERAMLIWGTGNLVGGVGALLIGFRYVIPDVLSVIGGNTLIALAWGLLAAGYRSFNGRPVRIGWALAPAVVLVAAFLAIGALGGGASMRGLAIGVVVTAILISAVVDCALADRVDPILWRKVIIVDLAGWIVVMAVRVLGAALHPASADPAGNSLLQAATALALTMLAVANGVAVLMVSRERIDRRLTELATVDASTRVFNRHGLELRYSALVRGGRHVVVVLADVDGLKEINDRHGHAVGDEVLRIFAEVTGRQLSSSDVLGRYGGDEFCLLVVDRTVEEARALADRVRQAVSEIVVTGPDGRLVRPTVSLGVGVVRRGRSDLREAAVIADAALYQAKADGRDRTSVAHSPGPADSPPAVGPASAPPSTVITSLVEQRRVLGIEGFHTEPG